MVDASTQLTAMCELLTDCIEADELAEAIIGCDVIARSVGKVQDALFQCQEHRELLDLEVS